MPDVIDSTIPAAKLAARRERKKRRPRIKTVTHKARSRWFQENAAWPRREAAVQTLVRERRRARRSVPRLEMETAWLPAGPTNIGGRMTAAVVHPGDADRIWAGSAGGGVWESRDAGKTWRPLWHDQESLNVGSLAIDPEDPDVLYCGTGEANLSADSYPGVGIYKSVNGGSSWRLVARSSRAGIPSRIGVIAVDPLDGCHLLIGGVGHHYPGEPLVAGRGGIYQSKDGGTRWSRLDFISPFEYRCHSIVFHPRERNVVYAAVTEQGAKNGIWRSEDGGRRWKQLTRGLPRPERFARTSLAIAPSNPDVIYAIAADNDSAVLGVYRSTNGGDSWKGIHGKAFHYRRGGYEYETQMNYNNVIAVSPKNSKHVICGGVDLHRTLDGGKTWQIVTKWDRNRGSKRYAHADHHALAYAQADPDRIYDLNDGGVDVSFDGGDSWTNRSPGLAVTMYYDLDVAQSNADYYGGGSQDNGTPLTVSGRPDDHFDVTGGDGGWLVFDPSDEDHIYASVYNMEIQRFPSSSGDWLDVTPRKAEDWERDSVWMVFIAMDPRDPRTVFTGSSRVWRTRNDGISWDPVSPFFKGTVSAIDIAPTDSGRIYVGTSYGEVFRSLDGGDTWSGNLAGATLPGFKVTRIKTSPADADRVILTVANFGTPHVYRSFDGCLSWEVADRGQLPDVPHNSVAIPRDYPNEVYVANDVGVFVSEDFGDRWFDLTGNLPNVSVVDLVYHDDADTLTAATYGRSLWKIVIRVPAR